MTIYTKTREAELRLAMLTLTPADATLFAGQLAEIQGYSELVDEDSSVDYAQTTSGATPLGLVRPASCVLEVEIA